MKSQYDWLEANYSNPDLKTDDLISQSGLSRDNYIEQLKELIGLSPKELITDFRMKKAIMFLENTEKSISDIAMTTGFNEPVNFTRLFKQTFGIAPSKYREQKKSEETHQPEELQTKEEETDNYELID